MQPVTQRQPLEVNNWTAGLITEASPLNFPEGSSVSEENFVLSRKKTRSRRLGLEYETGYSLINLGVSATASNYAINNFLWSNVREDPNKDYLVHQFGNKLYVFDTSATNVTAQQLFGGPITITASVVTQFSFAALQGKLIVATGDQVVRVINIESTGTYSISYLNLKVRDFWGVDDGFDTDERTSTLTHLHAYNLYNQGWPDVFFSTNYTGSVGANPNSMNEGANVDPVAQTNTSIGKYPSNADVIYSAMTFLMNGRKAYYPYALQNIVSGNTPAAKGHFIIDLFDRSQGRKDAYDTDVANGAINRVNYKASIPTDQSTGGVKATAAYAGRIWYACSSGETGGDSRSPHVGTFVLFSQLVDSTVDITKCYQEADPTAEDISDLVATDGGYVQLPDAANILALVPFGKLLLVFASNGVWAISGGTSGFSATEYQSEFISNNGVISKNSIVVTETAVVYWSRNGIYMLSPQGNAQLISAGKLEPQSLTEKTIQDLYNAIPYNSKQNVVGYYDDVYQRARWLYQATYSSSFPQRYTHELILDFSLPAWSMFTFKDIPARTPRVTGYAPIPVSRRGESNYKYSCIAEQLTSTYAMTLAGLTNTGWVDWYTADVSATSTASRGADAAAFLVTGYVTGGDSARSKYLPYLTVHFARTETFINSDNLSTTSTVTASASASDSYFADVILLLHGNVAPVQDFSPLSRPMTKGGTGTAISTTIFKYGVGSMSFDGSSDYQLAQGAGVNLDDEFTMEAWVYPERSNTWQAVLGHYVKGTSGQVSGHIYLTPRCQPYFELRNAFSVLTVPLSCTLTLTLNQWHHIAVTRNSSNNIAIWANGVQQGTPSLSWSGTVTSNLDRFYAGVTVQTGPVFTNYYKGKIDDARITRACRYTATFTPPDQEMQDQ